jgi:hypothetical protein
MLKICIPELAWDSMKMPHSGKARLQDYYEKLPELPFLIEGTIYPADEMGNLIIPIQGYSYQIYRIALSE